MTRGCCALGLAALLFACAGGEQPPRAGEPPAELSTDDLLTRIGAAAGSGDVAEAKRLAELAEGRDKTPRQAAMLLLLGANLAGPTARNAGASTPDPAPTWGRSIIRVRRTVLDSRIATAGYDSLPFFHRYREAASCCQYALFDLGDLAVALTDEPQPAEAVRRTPTASLSSISENSSAAREWIVVRACTAAKPTLMVIAYCIGTRMSPAGRLSV